MSFSIRTVDSLDCFSQDLKKNLGMKRFNKLDQRLKILPQWTRLCQQNYLDLEFYAYGLEPTTRGLVRSSRTKKIWHSKLNMNSPEADQKLGDYPQACLIQKQCDSWTSKPFPFLTTCFHEPCISVSTTLVLCGNSSATPPLRNGRELQKYTSILLRQPKQNPLRWD